MLKQTLRLIVLSLVVLAAAAPAALATPAPLGLELLGRTPAGGEATAEIAAFDPKTKRVFATDAENNQLDVFDFSKPATPLLLVPIDLSPYGAGPNSVVYLSNLRAVAVAVEAANVGEPGSVVVFDAKKGTHLATFPAGALPDMVTTSEDERYLLVANEGEPASDGSVDPEGSVTVIDLKRGLKKAEIETAGFSGVPLRGPVRVFTPGSTVEQDLEPEYITTNGDWAWVSIQEANAIRSATRNSSAASPSPRRSVTPTLTQTTSSSTPSADARCRCSVPVGGLSMTPATSSSGSRPRSTRRTSTRTTPPRTSTTAPTTRAPSRRL